MLPYILLMFLPLAFTFVAYYTNGERKGKLVIAFEENKNIIDYNLVLPIFFVILALLLSCRDKSIGRDLMNYEYFFEKISRIKFSDIPYFGLDALYVLLNWLVSRLTDNFQVLVAIVALITIIPIALLYCKNRSDSFMKIVLFMNMSNFVMLFSGLRQSIAVSIGIVAMKYVREKKPLKFILLVLIAMGMHHTGFMILLLYPLYHFTFKKKHLIAIIPSFIALLIFNNQIFTLLTRVLSRLLGDEYEVTISSTGAYTMLIFFVLLSMIAYIVPDETRMDREALGLRNFLLLATFLQCFAPVHTLSMRMNYYFVIFVPIAISKILSCAKDDLKDMAWVSKRVLVIFFMCYYLYTTYISCQTGISALDTYPYIPFWK